MTKKNKKLNKLQLSPDEIRVINIMINWLLAVIAMAFDIGSPVVWAFLGTSMGLLLGQEPGQVWK